jgi:anaerobic dimethyl sulfoxide reductase subunit B
MKNQKAFYFDASACTGCKACMAACKDRSDLPVDVNWRRVVEYGGGAWVPYAGDKSLLVPSNVYSLAISVSCNHCVNPVCVNACPTGAMHKREDGIVLVDADLCIGCRYCEWACPYSAPQFNEELKVMTKCDFCQDFLAAGGNPVCVDACVMRALDFGELDELKQKYGDVSAIDPLPTADITSPALVITPHRHSALSGEGTGRIIGPVVEVYHEGK